MQERVEDWNELVEEVEGLKPPHFSFKNLVDWWVKCKKRVHSGNKFEIGDREDLRKKLLKKERELLVWVAFFVGLMEDIYKLREELKPIVKSIIDEISEKARVRISRYPTLWIGVFDMCSIDYLRRGPCMNINSRKDCSLGGNIAHESSHFVRYEARGWGEDSKVITEFFGELGSLLLGYEERATEEVEEEWKFLKKLKRRLEKSEKGDCL